MYKYKIVVDSSSNLKNDYIKEENIAFEVVPLTIHIQGKEYVDDENINVKEMLDHLNSTEEKSTTSCPSPYSFEESYKDAKIVIAITISSKLSGCYNSAYLGAAQDGCESRVHVVDSKGTAGMMSLLVDKAYELCKQNLSFEEISEKIDDYQKSLNLLFVLNKFDNLVKNGRMSKVAAFIGKTIGSKRVCIADDGEIKVHSKLRTMKAALASLVENIGILCPSQEDRVCSIAYVLDDNVAQALKKLIESKYHFKEVRLEESRGLCSFYALEGGIIVSF